MSRIFLSHSSIDELEAVALKEWLARKGWDDVFLDLDPQRGLLAGERWQVALRRAADRCEAVVFVVTPAWAKSKWCLAEFLLAKSLNKRIFGAILKPVELSELPTELTAEWQLCHLVGEEPKETIAFTHKGQAQQIEFLTDGLTRLRIGLENAGLDARYFPWPPSDDPQRPPYRGLAPLDGKDAAIYFGRDAQIVRGLDALRGMRATGVETLFVILGPSGCGKSSFLRAGLLPRLKRDDRHFLPLEIIRPERQAITGEHGMANAIHKACVAFGLSGQTLGAIKIALMQDSGQLSPLLTAIQCAARERLRVDNEALTPPTLLLSVDQAEELFNPDATDEAEELFKPDATDEAHRFLALIGATLRDTGVERPSLIVAFTVRSDRYEPLQTAAELSGLKSAVFDDLKPMPREQFKEIITGPPRRAALAGKRLEIKPDLVEQLLQDCSQGADTLPLLSLMLSRLYRDYGSDGDLRLDEYHAMGGMVSVVNSEVETVLAPDTTERESQLAQLRAAFIPWLATINPQNDEPMRRLARYANLPAECHRLVDALAEKRLLLIDQRNSEKVVEVAHESLLRQWSMLDGWLQVEGENLKLAHDLEQATQDWELSDPKAAWAWLWMGERLSNAEGLAARPGYGKRQDDCREFLLESRHEEDAKRAEEEQRRTFNKKVLEDLVRNNSHIALTIMWNAAISLTNEGNLALLEDVVETSERSLGNSHPDTIARKLSLASTLKSRGEINRAKLIEDEAQQHRAKSGVFDHNTHDRIERRLKDIDWTSFRGSMYFPSPSAWEDQVLYLLMLDRYSDGNEQGYRDNTGNMVDSGSTPPFNFEADANSVDRRLWTDAGADWLGGTLKGLESKIGYLARLGVTVLWMSPPFRQVAFDHHAYHGRNIQNFLDIDPHYGTRQDLIDLVNTAHAYGIRVILTTVLAHGGDVFAYGASDSVCSDVGGAADVVPHWDGRRHPVAGYRDNSGCPTIPFGPIDEFSQSDAWPDGAIWPREFQPAATFSCKGRIDSWDNDPEYLEGDFVTLKDIDHGYHDRDVTGQRILDAFHATEALRALVEVYKFWIVLTDIDGFSIDSVKHLEPGATRYFVAAIKEFARSLGKESFFMEGEITGGRENAFYTMELTGLDAALGISDIPDRMDYLAKGLREPGDYFNLFRMPSLVNKSSQVWFGKHVVTLFDDHDQVRKGNNKGRFCGDKGNDGYKHIKAVLGLNLCSMGIPCIYYGTEQGFDGAGDSDHFLRECMFGGSFGSMQSAGRHFFNEDHEIYKFISDVNVLRQSHPALRRGSQFLRKISEGGDPGSFCLPHMIGGEIRSVVPWSRIFDRQELLLAINTDASQTRSAWVTVDAVIHEQGGSLTCLYSSDPAQLGETVPIEPRNGRAVRITVPAGGFVAYG